MRKALLISSISVLAFSLVHVSSLAQKGERNAVSYLSKVMDKFHTSFDVYTDLNAAGNHFLVRAKMGAPGEENAIPPMDEASTENPRSGATCIKATFKPGFVGWGGWYFMNGVLKDNAPAENWGDEPNAGINLKGATKLTFWARGEKGGEVVQFFALGVGRDPFTGHPIKPHPDSSPRVSTGWITLTREWRQYTINLKGRDLSYVLGGFGWVTEAGVNSFRSITFYIDDIQYDKARLNEPRFLVSYETIRSKEDFDVVMSNVAFTYDNALALLAFLAAGEDKRAKLIADALVYAQEHDRFYKDGRLRNAYQGGDLTLPPGWAPHGRIGTVRIPGYYDLKKNQWFEDRVQVGTYAGNVAWAMLALLAYYEMKGGDTYLKAAIRMGEWVEKNCRDTRGAGGYTAGFEGWEPNPVKLMYKSTEHNIDLYAAFQRLYLVTKDEKWRKRAEHAKKFVLAMWDSAEGKFWTGTVEDGVKINKEVIPLDVQAWALLSLREESKPYWKALKFAESHHRVGKGFDFNQDRDGIWFEGTAQMALAYHFTGQKEKWQTLVSFLKSAQLPSGGLPAANKDGLTTGFYLHDGKPWLYFRRAHVGATAWLILAEKGVNPFWMGSKK